MNVRREGTLTVRGQQRSGSVQVQGQARGAKFKEYETIGRVVSDVGAASAQEGDEKNAGHRRRSIHTPGWSSRRSGAARWVFNAPRAQPPWLVDKLFSMLSCRSSVRDPAPRTL